MRASSLAFACLAVRCSKMSERLATFMGAFSGVIEPGEGSAVSRALPARRILILDPACSSCLHDLQAAGFEVTAEQGLSNCDLEHVLQTNSYDAVVVRSANQISRSMLVSSSRLAVVGRAGSGVDNIDLVAAAELGVPVVNSPTGNTRSVAELVFGLMLGISRSIPEAHATLQRGEWAKSRFNGHTLAGKTLGVIGFGSVGQELARMAIGFGMAVLIANQSSSSIAGNEDQRAAVASEIGVKGPLSLDDILSQSDFLSVHVPLTLDTRGFIGKLELAKMKSSAVVINAARGGVIDEQALLAALERGQLGGAALDVFEKEKAPLENHIVRLCRFPNVICTPHIGGSTEEAGERVLGEVCCAVVGVLDGTLPPERVVSGNARESLRRSRERLGLPPSATL